MLFELIINAVQNIIIIKGLYLKLDVHISIGFIIALKVILGGILCILLRRLL